MADFDITSTNATGVLVVDQLFPAGIELEMFGTDQSVVQDSVQVAETRMSVDGKMVAGYLPAIFPVTITLEAPSRTAKSFGTLYSAMATNKTIYECSLTFTVPSVGKIYTWSKGVLHDGVPFPSNKKVLDPTTWVFHFERLDITSF